MSYVTIDYKSLEDASDEAKAVSKKLEDYAETLHRKVYKKLEEYSGTDTDNIWIAKNNIDTKISNLYSRSKAYATYAQDLADLKSQCESVDRAVKTKVSRLSAEFKQSHGIKNSVLENTVNYHLISFKNTSSVGRWISDKADVADSFLDYIAESIEDWWDYEGGEEYTKGFANATLETVLAVCAVAGAIVSGAALAVTVAAITAACIAVADALISMYHEVGAYNLVQSDDPATAKRRQEIDKLTDHLKSSFVYGGDGEEYAYNQTYQNVSIGISAVNGVCEIITFVDGAKDLAKKGYKWATGSGKNLDDIRFWEDVVKKETWQAFRSKATTKVTDAYGITKTGINELYTAVRTGGIKNANTAFSSDSWKQINGFLSTSGHNIKDSFIKQCKGYTLNDVRGAGNTQKRIEAEKDFIENYVGITEHVVEKGFSFDAIKDIGWDGFIKPSIKDGMTDTIFKEKKKTQRIEEEQLLQERTREEADDVDVETVETANIEETEHANVGENTNIEINFIEGFNAGLGMGIVNELNNRQSQGIDVSGDGQVEGDENNVGISTTSRPTWRQSELDAATDFPDYDAQKSFINGEEVPYGTKGSVRPDYYKAGFSVDIKNYNVESVSGRSNLTRNIEKQYYQRIENLPDGTNQSVMIDVRGQNISDATLNALYDDIMLRTNNGVEILFKMD